MDVPFSGGVALANEAPADQLLGREADGGHPAGAAENGADPNAGGVLGNHTRVRIEGIISG